MTAPHTPTPLKDALLNELYFSISTDNYQKNAEIENILILAGDFLGNKYSNAHAQLVEVAIKADKLCNNLLAIVNQPTVEQLDSWVHELSRLSRKALASIEGGKK